MNRIITIILIILLSIPAVAAEQFRPRLILKLSDEAAQTARANPAWLPAQLAARQITELRIAPVFTPPADSRHLAAWSKLEMDRWFQVRGEFDAEALLSELRVDHEIEYSELDHPKFACVESSDYSIFDMWGLERMRCPEAWDLHHGDSEVIITTIDTGCRIDHEDLAANIYVNPGEDLNGNGAWDESDNNGIDDDENGYVDDLVGWDFFNQVVSEDEEVEGEDYFPRDNMVFPDVHGHGTHVMGTAAAVTDNNIGVAAASWNVRALPLRAGAAVYDPLQNLNGIGWDSDFAPAIQYAADMGARVISISFGGPGGSQVYQTAVTYARSNNVLVFAAAGNDNSSQVQYPAGYNGVIAVAATNGADVKAGFSSYGNWVDISAPGVSIYSTMSNNMFHQTDYVAWQGTSMATPNAASVAALVLNYDPTITDDELEAIIITSADNIEAVNPNYLGQLGSGRVNAELALETAMGDSLPSPELNGVALDDETGQVQIFWTFDPEGRTDFIRFRIHSSNGVDWVGENTNLSYNLPDYGYYTFEVRAEYTAGLSLPVIATVNWDGSSGLPVVDDFEQSLSQWDVQGTAEIVDDPLYAGVGALGVYSSGINPAGIQHDFDEIGGIDCESWIRLAAYPPTSGRAGVIIFSEQNGILLGSAFDNNGKLNLMQIPPFPPQMEVLHENFTAQLDTWYKVKLHLREGLFYALVIDSEWNVVLNETRIIPALAPDGVLLGSFGADAWNYFDNVRAYSWDGSELQYFTPANPTLIAYPIIITDADVFGTLQPGSEIAVMRPNGNCVGAEIVDGEWPLELTAWGADGALPGFMDGENMRFFVWNEFGEVEVDAVYDLGDGHFGDGRFARVRLIYYDAADEPSAVIDDYKLYPAYPNPFNPSTTIRFDLREAGLTTLSIYNLLGQKVHTLVNTSLERGSHEFTFDARDLASGVYLYRLESGDYVSQKKMVLLK